MTYDMTTPIGPVTRNEWTCGTNPNIQKPLDRLKKIHADVGFCA